MGHLNALRDQGGTKAQHQSFMILVPLQIIIPGADPARTWLIWAPAVMPSSVGNLSSFKGALMLVPAVCPCAPMDLVSEQQRTYLETAAHAADSALGGLPRCTGSKAEAESHTQVRHKHRCKLSSFSHLGQGNICLPHCQ